MEPLPARSARTISVPGRVNLIGEHVDYHHLPVLPVAIGRRVQITYRPSSGRRIHVTSEGQSRPADFDWTTRLEPGPPGDWHNYVKAAAQAVQGRWKLDHGIEASIVSDLPAAAGLSSSSALLVAVTLALLDANDVTARFEDLMEVLPEGEYFVGTRGGGMDHASVLAARAGCALLIHFAPLSTTPIPIPKDWAILGAHSLTTAEKSTALSAEYNSRRTAGTSALHQLGFTSYQQALASAPLEELTALARRTLDGEQLRCFLHVTGEAARVDAAVTAMHNADAETFGRLLNESQASLKDLLRISTPQLDALTQAAIEAGALGARLTGAGFGGFAVILCERSSLQAVRTNLERSFYQGKSYDPQIHLLEVEPSNGALYHSP